MNPPPSRPACHVVRALAALGNGPESPPRWISRHRDSCTACASYFTATASLESGLRRQAATVTVTPPPGLDSRILQVITSEISRRPAQSAGHRARRFRSLALAGAAAGLVALLALTWRTGDPESAANGAVPPQPIASADGTLPLLQGLRNLAAPVTGALAEDPLQAEMDQVYAEARSAARFLAANFLPSSSPNSENEVIRFRRADG